MRECNTFIDLSLNLSLLFLNNLVYFIPISYLFIAAAVLCSSKSDPSPLFRILSKLPPSRALEQLQTVIQRSKNRHGLFLVSKKCLELGAHQLFLDALNKLLSVRPDQEHVNEDNPTAMKLIVDTL